MNCPDGYYNQVGTLLLNLPGGVGFNILYWEKAQNYDPVSLLIAGVAYHILLLLLFGSSISMGTFIPLLCVGACYGRAFAILMMDHTNFITDDQHRDAIVTTYTMVCSVALLAGVVRVLISLTVVMICSIGTTYLITPLWLRPCFPKSLVKPCSAVQAFATSYLK